VKRKPKSYKIVTHLKPGQVLAEDELELLGRVPDNTLPASSLRPYNPQSAYMQQTDMSQMQMPQMQMPQMQMPQVQMPQIQLPGGMQIQMPQIQMPQIQLGRSAEAPSGVTTSVAEATLPACVQMLDNLNSAVSAKDIAAAAAKADAIAVSADCGQFQVVAQRRIAALRLSAAQEMMAADKPVSDYEPLLLAANGPQVLWQASATLGEVYFSERRFADAAADFQRAIEIIKNETRTPKAPPAETIDGIIQRAAQARILAANPSADNPQGTFVPVEKDHRSGMLGGIYSQDVRGIVPVSIPVPITFDFDKSTFTQVGTDAAKELVEAIKEQKPGRIVLIGHTDRRGGDDYNQKLSVRRAQAVADFLKENGIDATIEAEGRGASDPLDVSAVANLTDDDIDALNRRVEWRRE
ncbi:MAG TPA: OmpA family protein, partial [Mycoplana sp.]|nr:OmpA family protein [Mycoplana sp.]